MSKDYSLLITHMLKAIEEIELFTHDLSVEDYESNPLIQRATERCFEIIGEAATKIPDSFRAEYPHIPWSSMRGMRNILIHQYDTISPHSVWQTIKHDLPPLKLQLLDLNKSLSK